MRIRETVFACGVLCGLVLAAQVHAAPTTGGIDTLAGVTSLPLAVEGTPVITLTPNTATVNGALSATGNLTATNGYVQMGAYPDTGLPAQPACNAASQGALIYSTTQKTALVCNGTTRTWQPFGGAGCSVNGSALAPNGSLIAVPACDGALAGNMQCVNGQWIGSVPGACNGN